MADLNWTTEQRAKIDEAIAAKIENSRLAHKLIPEYKLSPNDRAVSKDQLIYHTDEIDEKHVDLLEFAETFVLTKLQSEDEDLSGALLKACRAAQKLARKHDEQVFSIAIRKAIVDANATGKENPDFHTMVDIDQPYPDGLVAATSAAVAALDGEGYSTGFVMVAGLTVYTFLYSRAPGAAEIPVKAIQGLLEGGPIHRSAVLPADEALILSISGEEMDRAIALPPTLEFLRIGAGEKREFRLYERYLPRFKQTFAAVLLRLKTVAVAKKGP